MDLTDMLVPLELAYRYCRENPTNRQHYEVLGEVIHSTFIQAIKNKVDMRFIQRDPVFQQAWELFTTPNTQLRSNVLYLKGRLPSF